MKLSISNIGWEKKYDDVVFAHLKQKKYDGVEIAPTRIIAEQPYLYPQKGVEFVNQLAQFNLKVSSMQSIWFGKSENMFFSETDRTILLEYTKEAILFAEKVDCHNLVFGCPKNRNIGEHAKFGCESGKDFFRELGMFALSHHTVLALEANPTIYKTNYINTTKEAFDMVKEVGCDGFMVNLDLGTILYNNESLDILTGQVKYINHVHISEPNLSMIKPRVQHEYLAKILHDEKYSGYISIEMKTCEDVNKLFEIIDYVHEVFSF